MRRKFLHVAAILVCVSCIASTVSGNDCKYQPKKVQYERNCRKPCKTTEGCNSLKKKCLCDDVCGMTCFNPNAECQEKPEEIINGKMEYEEMKYGSIVRYSCLDGFKMKGESERKCQSDRKWSGKPPKCIGDGCPFPPRIDSSFADTDESLFRVGDVVTFKCRFGFTLSGSPNITCQSGSTWSTAKFICVKVNCGDPGKPLNGWVEAGDFSFGNWATYKCDEGYELKEPTRTRRYCSTTGRWSGSPSTCMIKTCRPPKAPSHGEANAALFEYGSLVEYSCDQGYMLNGNKEGTCNDDGEWGEMPSCDVDINCKFEIETRPICGYTNAGSTAWKREFVNEGKDGLPSYAASFAAEGGVVLRSPSIPSGRPHCVKFYYYVEKQLASNDDLMIRLNNEKVAVIVKNGLKVPTHRWVGFQASLIPDKEEIIFEIVVQGSTRVLIDELEVTKGKCEPQCELHDPCENEGICVDEVKSTFCSCTEFFKGARCETEIRCTKPELDFGTVKGPDRLVFGSTVYFECDTGYELRGAASFATCTRNGLSAETPVCAEVVKYHGQCPIHYNEAGMMCYRLVKEYKTYPEAEKICVSQGARLAVVQSKPIDKFLHDLQPDWWGSSYYWIGLRTVDSKMKWSSGDTFQRGSGIDYELENAGQNNCAAYHFKRVPYTWEILFQSCDKKRRFICERWKQSASSYVVKTEMQNIGGVYKPVAGLVTESTRQIFKKDDGFHTYLYYDFHPATSQWGWYIGQYSIMEALPDQWDVRTITHVLYPDEITSAWESRNQNSPQIRIIVNDKWSQWTKWSCAVTCGSGNSYKRRICNDEDPETLACKGSDVEKTACSTPICKVTEEFRGMRYTFEEESVSWHEAKRGCEKKGMQLADSTDKVTQARLIQRFVNAPYWINGIKDLPEWEFSNGTIIPKAQRLWSPQEPNGYRNSKDCVELNYGGWNDHGCALPRSYICQAEIQATIPPVMNPCLPDPCNGRGTCQDDGNGKYLCFCKTSYTGRNCLKEVGGGNQVVTGKPRPTAMRSTTAPRANPCLPDPCNGKGKCRTSDNGNFACFCKAPYTGRNCDKISTTTTTIPTNDPCSPDPCNGGGKCSTSNENAEGFLCFCRTGNFGKYCETRDACPVDKVIGEVNFYKNGVLLKNSAVVSKGETVVIKCKKSFQEPLGEVTLTCEGLGQWAPSARIFCVSKSSVCTLKSVSEEIFDVYFQNEQKVGSFPVNIQSGTYLRFGCKTDVGNSGLVVHCKDGQWQSTIPSRCVSGPTCPDVKPPGNGSMVVSPDDSSKPYEVGVSITFHCNRLYKLTGAPTIRCLNGGSWSSPPSQCTEVGCLLFITDLNAEVFVKNHQAEEDEIYGEPGERYSLRCRNSKSKKSQIRCMGKDRWEPSYVDFYCT